MPPSAPSEAPPLEGTRLRTVTGALMLSLFLAATEMTFVTAAMPTIVSQLGGLETYSWVFSGFQLSFTASIAVFGKLADVFGRRRVYAAAMAVFVASSLLCGIARDMTELVLYRVLQGIGAGGVMPLVFTIIGDVYSFEQRARVQGLFAGVWGLASVLGPVLGGFLVDRVSWRWVFLLNVPAGIVATAVLVLAWREPARPRRGRVDVLGTVLLVGAVVGLLFTLLAAERAPGPAAWLPWLLAAATTALAFALARVERRAADPVVPVRLFADRLFVAACGHSFAVGFAVFGAITFIPLFVQFGFGVGATEAGASLTPLLLAWVATANVGSRLLLRFPFRSIALAGMTLVVLGLGGMIAVTAESPRAFLLASTSVMGLGMGLSSPVFLIAVQTTLPRASLGTATSTLQLCRSIGTAVGIAVMGALVAYHVAGGFDAARPAAAGMVFPPGFRAALAAAERSVFAVAFVAALGGFACTAYAPAGRLRDRVVPSPEPGASTAI